jgi:hypothetical protein
MSGEIEDLSGLSDKGLIGNRYFQEPRFASRVAYMGYVTDPSVNRYRNFLRQMMRGGVVEEKLRGVSREAVGRATAAARTQAGDLTGGTMGAGLSAPGMEAYLNRKLDAALAGQMGEAYRQAAVADVNARSTAGQALERDALNRYNMMMNIANMAGRAAPYSQKTAGTGKNPWKALGMQALGTAAGVGVGALTGGLMGALVPSIGFAQGAMAGMGWNPMLAMMPGASSQAGGQGGTASVSMPQQYMYPAGATNIPPQYSQPIGPAPSPDYAPYGPGYGPQQYNLPPGTNWSMRHWRG